MPSVSKAQQRFMAGVASGHIKAPGLSPQKAKEYVTSNYKSLPERKSKFKRLNKYMGSR